MSDLWTIVVRGGLERRPHGLLRLVRAFPSLIATVVIFFARKLPKWKQQKTKKEREDVN